MTTHQPLSLFISSKMQELANERQAVLTALRDYRLYGWIWENDAGARPEPIRSTYLKEVEACDIYLGLFWLGYGSYTIEEFDHAHALKKPCLIYEKHVRVEERSQELTVFLGRLQQVASPDGLTVCRFVTSEQLASQVQTDVMRLLTTIFRTYRQQPTLHRVWNIPYHRNLYFTGREDMLQVLHDHLIAAKVTALTQSQAISGLGGVGKTQIAVEYAYRHHEEYHSVLWVNAATRDTILTSFLELVASLDLSEKQESDQNKIVAAVKHWLSEHSRWLLIFDNADDLTLVEEFFPTSNAGNILLTTRNQTPGVLADSLTIETMSKDEGTLLVLRRAKLLARDACLEQAKPEDRAYAESIVDAMDGLPLALDQAAAYIEETHCRLDAFLEKYERRRAEILQRRGGTGRDHPLPVATTWSLSFTQVQQLNPVAADLLRICAFLAPDAIPEEMLVGGATELGPLLGALKNDTTHLDEAIATLNRFSLIRRNRDNQTIFIHRLVQDVFRTSMNEQEQRQWAERVIKSIDHVFPSVEVDTWHQCKRLISQAQACARLIDRYILTFPEAARLLNRAAFYLDDHALYLEAERLYQLALAIREQTCGLDHRDTAQSLNNLATLYKSQGKFEQAEPLYQRALVIFEQKLGPDDPHTATILNNLALLYKFQGKFEQAEPLYRRALAIREQALGYDHPSTATSFNNLALLYKSQGKFEQAERLYRRALAIREQICGPNHPDTAQSLNNLAIFYKSQGKYKQAEPLYQRALAIYEQVLGPDHPNTATSLNNLALLYKSQGKYEQAEPLYQHALAISEQILGPEHPDTAQSLNNLAALFYSQNKDEQAEPLYQRALAIREQALGPKHPDTAQSLSNLAVLYYSQGKYEQAEPLFQRALAIRENTLGPEHPDTAESLNNLATLYDSQGKFEQAERLCQRALAIREQTCGPNHPDTAQSLNNLATLYKSQGKYEQAERLYQRALVILEQELGSDHPSTATILNNLALLYKNQGKYEQVEPLLKRALAISERILGPGHLDTAQSLSNLAALYEYQGKYEQAEPFFQRALAIRENTLGPEHPDTAESLNNLAELYGGQGKYEQAESLHQRALAIRRQILGLNHPDTAQSLNNLAALYYRQDKYEQAEPLLQDALSVMESTLGSEHPNTKDVRENYAVLLEDMNHKKK